MSRRGLPVHGPRSCSGRRPGRTGTGSRRGTGRPRIALVSSISLKPADSSTRPPKSAVPPACDIARGRDHPSRAILGAHRQQLSSETMGHHRLSFLIDEGVLRRCRLGERFGIEQIGSGEIEPIEEPLAELGRQRAARSGLEDAAGEDVVAVRIAPAGSGLTHGGRDAGEEIVGGEHSAAVSVVGEGLSSARWCARAAGATSRHARTQGPRAAVGANVQRVVE